MSLLRRFNGVHRRWWLPSRSGSGSSRAATAATSSPVLPEIGLSSKIIPSPWYSPNCTWSTTHGAILSSWRFYSSSVPTSPSVMNYAFARTQQDEQVIRDLFLSFATQEDGDHVPFLRVEDLRDLLLAIGDSPSDEKLAQLIEAVDQDGNGKIDYREFLGGCKAILETAQGGAELDIDSIIDIFFTLDADGSGDLEIEELSGALSTAGVSLSKEEAYDIMKSADTNGDGKICLDEFLALMTDQTKSKHSWRIRSGFRVCLIMGGPGSGKGTLCEKLIEHAHVRHCSSGDMLREEIARGSPLAKSIENIMKEGKLVPASSIIALIKKRLRRYPGSLVALDGFPRNKQNYVDFDKVLGTPEFAIYVDVPDEEMVKRIAGRAITSGRADDNEETARKRLETFHKETMPTMEQLNVANVPIYNLDGTKSPEGVWDELLETCPQIGTRVSRLQKIFDRFPS